MSSEKVVDLAADGVADGLHVISEEALATEKAVRSLDRAQIGYISLSLAAGAAIGAFVGYKVAFKRLEAKYNQIAEDEIASMRKYYNDKVVALDSSTTKGDLDEIVRKRGYSVEESGRPPMAVTPPEAVVDAARETAEEESTDEIIDVDEVSEPEVRNVFREAEVEDTWDYHEERRRRSPIKPYVIHVDEREDQQAYDGVTFTYYETDDVLSNERDEVISEAERDKLIGETNLGKFGHGSNDASVVYIRNDQLEMDIEVVRSPNSYAEEVHGFDPPEIRHAHRRGRSSFDDDESSS